MKTLECDVAIVGAGTAGLAAHGSARAAGAKVLLIDEGPGGTTCARVGCMPSKLLLAGARAAHAVETSGTFGVQARAVEIDGRAVMKRVQTLRDHFVRGVLDQVSVIPAREKLHGRARFASSTELTVDDHTLVQARAIVIGVGARPAVPPALKDACGDRVLTHEDIFDLKDLPTSLAVIGAGPLGLELALAFARLKVPTTVFDSSDAIGGISDPEVGKVARRAFDAELRFHLGVDVEAARAKGGDVTLSWSEDGGRTSHGTFQYVLDAAGRPPALPPMDLNMSGLELDDDGVPVFDKETLRCGDSSIYLAGDADGWRPVLHEASWQGELAGANAAHPEKPKRRPVRVAMAVAYTDPDIAVIGAGFDADEAKAWAIGLSDDNGRATVDGRDPGVLRVYARKDDGVLIGGELFGPDVEHLAHLLAWAVQLEMPLEKILELPFYHPTVEEGLRSALLNAKAQLT